MQEVGGGCVALMVFPPAQAVRRKNEGTAEGAERPLLGPEVCDLDFRIWPISADRS
jgi:hypothetical protein